VNSIAHLGLCGGGVIAEEGGEPHPSQGQMERKGGGITVGAIVPYSSSILRVVWLGEGKKPAAAVEREREGKKKKEKEVP